MFTKKEKILNSALQLFANFGYESISTARIAKRARVSEALIFKHFRTKISLLNAVVDDGQEKFKSLAADIVLETNPKKLLKAYIELPFKLKGSELDLWKLEYKLRMNPTVKLNTYSKPIYDALVKAFTNLKIANPKTEAHLLMYTIDGILLNIISGEIKNKTKIKSQLKNKYKI